MVAHLLTRRLQHYVVRIPNANIYRFGDPDGAQPVLRAVDWTVREGESWAVVGSGVGEKTALLEVSKTIIIVAYNKKPFPSHMASQLALCEYGPVAYARPAGPP